MTMLGLESRLGTTNSQSGWGTAARGAGADATYAAAPTRYSPWEDVSEERLADEPRWPAWKVTLVVVVFCAAFWTGIGYIAVRLLG